LGKGEYEKFTSLNRNEHVEKIVLAAEPIVPHDEPWGRIWHEWANGWLSGTDKSAAGAAAAAAVASAAFDAAAKVATLSPMWAKRAKSKVAAAPMAINAAKAAERSANYDQPGPRR
jgi:hypothetical protein